MKTLLHITMPQARWNIIIPSYLIACGFALFFQTDFFEQYYHDTTSGSIFQHWSFLPAGIATLLATVFAKRYDTITIRTMSIMGNNRLKNFLLTIIPLCVFTSFGISNPFHLDSHLYAGVFALIALVYALSEEIFWRGYLFDALRPLGSIKSIIIIGIAWWAWHLRFSTMFEWTGFLLICVGSSFLLSKFASETLSTLTTAGLHSFIILTTNGRIGGDSLIPSILTVLFWIAVGTFWKSPQKQHNTA